MATTKKTPKPEPEFAGPRADLARNAAVNLNARSFYVDRMDDAGGRVGQERTINAALDPMSLISVEGGELIVGAVVYDANPTEFARPVRLVMGPAAAKGLAADLVRWAEVLDGGSG